MIDKASRLSCLIYLLSGNSSSCRTKCCSPMYTRELAPTKSKTNQIPGSCYLTERSKAIKIVLKTRYHVWPGCMHIYRLWTKYPYYYSLHNTIQRCAFCDVTAKDKLLLVYSSSSLSSLSTKPVPSYLACVLSNFFTAALAMNVWKRK